MPEPPPATCAPWAAARATPRPPQPTRQRARRSSPSRSAATSPPPHRSPPHRRPRIQPRRLTPVAPWTQSSPWTFPRPRPRTASCAHPPSSSSSSRRRAVCACDRTKMNRTEPNRTEPYGTEPRTSANGVASCTHSILEFVPGGGTRSLVTIGGSECPNIPGC